MNHSFYLNPDDEARYQEMLVLEKGKSESAFIRSRIFRKRERYSVQSAPLDLQFLSTLSNLVSSVVDNLHRSADIKDELAELQRIINEKMDAL